MLNDIKEIKGNENVKRALEIAVFGDLLVNIIAEPGFGATSLLNAFYSINKKFNKHSSTMNLLIELSDSPDKSFNINVRMLKLPFELYYEKRYTESNDDVLKRLVNAKENYTEPSLDTIDKTSITLLKSAFDKMNLTFSDISNIELVAQKIAHLEGSKTIQPIHIAEAIQYSHKSSFLENKID
jgi:predicted ATPase with chaperone activity